MVLGAAHRRSHRPGFTKRLLSSLARSLSRDTETELTPEHVAEALDHTKTPMYFAGWLACQGNAFAYGPNTPERREGAKKAFEGVREKRP